MVLFQQPLLTFSNPSINRVGILTKLKGYYKFDETSGKLINLATSVGSTDSFGTGADMTNDGLTQEVTGLIDEAYDYDGIDDNSEARISLGGLGYPFTFNAWVNPDTLQNGAVFGIAFHLSHGGYYFIAVREVDSELFGEIHRRISPTFTVIGSIPLPFDGSTWSMITGLFISDTSMKLYVNGIFEGEDTNSVIYNVSASNIWFGRKESAASNVPYAGKIDEGAIWARVLTEAEILTLYNSGSGLAL